MSDNIKILKYILPLFLGWRISLIFIAFFGLGTFINIDQDKRLLYWPSYNLEYWIRWATWDGGHFRAIAENGYLPIQTVFLPLYPILIHILYMFGIPSLWGGLLVSNISLVIALFYFYKLCLLDYKATIAKKAVFALLIFPTAFYLGAVYSESLFLALTISSFYFARKKSWMLAFFLAGLTVITRLVGVAVVLGVAIEYLFENEYLIFSLKTFWKSTIRRILVYMWLVTLIYPAVGKIAFESELFLFHGVIVTLNSFIFNIFLITIGLVIFEFILRNVHFKKVFNIQTLGLVFTILPIFIYILYQGYMFNNPFSFLTNESHWGRVQSYPWDPLVGDLRFLMIHHFFETAVTTRVVTEFLFILIFTTCLLFSIFHSTFRIRISYQIFFFLTLIIPFFSGTTVSVERYMLIIFPVYIIFALIKNEILEKVGIVISTMLLAIYTVLFINNYWVT